MAYRDADARTRLSGIADAFLVHDRPIRMRCDDSVVRLDRERSWPSAGLDGCAPSPLTFTLRVRCPVLGAGPELKHTFCLGVDEPTIRLLTTSATSNTSRPCKSLTHAIDHFTRLFAVGADRVAAHDLHPEYLSTKVA